MEGEWNDSSVAAHLLDINKGTTEAHRAALKMGFFTKSDMAKFAIGRARRWDTITFADGATVTPYNSRFFLDVGPSSHKTRAMCNLDQPGRLNAPERFLIERILFVFSSSTPEENARHFIDEAYFYFQFLSKHLTRCPLISLPRVGNRTQKAPLRVCLSCRSVSLDLSCKKCGAPEWEYLLYGGEESPDDADMDGIKLMIDLTGNEIALTHEMAFSANFEISNFTLPSWCRGNGKRGLKLMCVLEGWEATAVQ